jgi:hypothetical protein
MVEQDSIAGKQLVGVPVIPDDVIGIDLGGGVRALRLEKGPFMLWRGGGPEHFT